MAKRTVIEDDLNGSPDARTVMFSFDGADYEIDLGPENFEKFEGLLHPYIDAGRRTGGRSAAKRVVDPGKRNLKEVREWAKKNGYEVSERGRVPQQFIDAYDADNAAN